MTLNYLLCPVCEVVMKPTSSSPIEEEEEEANSDTTQMREWGRESQTPLTDQRICTRYTPLGRGERSEAKLHIREQPILKYIAEDGSMDQAFK